MAVSCVILVGEVQPGVVDSIDQRQRNSSPLLTSAIGSFVISILTQCRVNYGWVGTLQDIGLSPAWHGSELSGACMCSAPGEKSWPRPFAAAQLNLSPVIPAMMRARLTMRSMVVGSLKRMMLMMAVPTAPMPTQTA